MDQNSPQRRRTDENYVGSNNNDQDRRLSNADRDSNLAGNDTLTGLFLLSQISSGVREDEVRVIL